MQIIWRRAAVHDLAAIGEFIAQDNTEAASRVRAAIQATVSRLADHPDLGRAGRVDGTREVVTAHVPYIVVYRVAEDQVRIPTMSPVIPRSCRSLFRHDVARLRRPAGGFVFVE